MALLKKKLTFAFAIALMLVACGDDSVSGSKSEINEATVVVDLFDDLPNCGKNRNGDIAEVLGEKKAYLCDNGRWEYDHDILDSVKTENDLSACLAKNEGDSVWVVDESAVFVCVDRKWEKHEIEKSVEDSGFIPVYKSDDDLPNCTKERQNSMAMVDSVVQLCKDGRWEIQGHAVPNCTKGRQNSMAMVNSVVLLCKDGRWEIQGHAYATEGDLPNCTAKRNRESVYLLDSEIKMICLDKRWMDSRDIAESSSAGKVASSSSKKTSSSSSVVSSSSKKVESSSASKHSSSSVASVKESSSSKKIESSSSVKLSSSVKVSSSSTVSSSSKKVESSSSVQSSSSHVALNTQYDCSKYNCVSTQYLNQKMLAAGKYGELLDSRDNQVYRTTTICGVEWMAQNLQFNSKIGDHYCYNDDSTYCIKYGRLYTRAAASCPTGWHLPNDTEWGDLFKCVGSQSTAAAQLRASTGWDRHPELNDSDPYGFSSLPAGVYHFGDEGNIGWYLSDTGYNDFSIGVEAGSAKSTAASYTAISVRCVKNSGK
jgi:uncharacterized protein (TIGR02145 family)